MTRGEAMIRLSVVLAFVQERKSFMSEANVGSKRAADTAMKNLGDVQSAIADGFTLPPSIFKGEDSKQEDIGKVVVDGS